MKILIISNCSTEPYRRIFSCFLPDANVSSLHISQLGGGDAMPAGQDFIVVLSSHRNRLPADKIQGAKIIEIPNFYFSGYHPDTSYVALSNTPNVQVPSGAGVYHSTLAFSAFKCGLNIEKTLSLYQGETYERLGYMGEYEKSKNSLLMAYRDSSLPIDGLFRKWSRKGCFMHTFNHPHNACFQDIAKQICETHLGRSVDFPHVLPDTLAQNMIYPCYPEIAERRGTTGSYTFKVDGEFRSLDLAGFVTQSFEKYESRGRDNMMISPAFKTKFDAACAYILEVQ